MVLSSVVVTKYLFFCVLVVIVVIELVVTMVSMSVTVEVDTFLTFFVIDEV